MIVGDDDQVDLRLAGPVENIQRFPMISRRADHSSGAELPPRPANILSAANALIENNNGRLGKNCGLTALTANRYRCTALSTNWMKRACG